MKAIKYLTLAVALLMSSLTGSVRAQVAPDSVRAITWKPDGTLIAYASEGGIIWIADTNGKPVKQLNNDAAIHALRWSPNGTLLASGDDNGVLKVWNVQTGTIQNQIQAHHVGYAETSIAWSPDSKKLAGLSFNENAVVIWTVANNKADIEFGVGEAYAISWSPDGTQLAVDRYGRLEIWDPIKPIMLKLIKMPANGVYVSWSPDGKQLASDDGYTHDDFEIRIWDTNTFTLKTELKGHKDVIWSADWDPTGKKLITSSADKTVKVWDVASGQTIATYQANVPLFSAAWSPFGGRIAYVDGLSSGNSASTGSAILTNPVLTLVVPPASKDDLKAIITACVTDATAQQALTSQLEAIRLPDFIGAVNAMPADKLPSACAADLIAVTQALQKQ